MRQTLFILSLLASLQSLAQFEYVDQSALYIALDIHEVNAYDNDSGQKVNDERWLLDEQGRTYSHKLLETEDDSSFSLKLYFYDNAMLIKSFDIGVWNTSTNKLDTAITTYLLDERGKYLQSVQTNTRNTDRTVTIYDYDGDRPIRSVHTDANGRLDYIDSTYYYKTLVPHIKSKTQFLPIFGTDTLEITRRVLQYFDTTGAINLELEFTDDTYEHLTPIRSKSFVYHNRKLSQTIKLYLGASVGWGMEMRKTEEIYYYDSRGLVIKKEWYSDGSIEPYLVYTYEYK